MALSPQFFAFHLMCPKGRVVWQEPLQCTAVRWAITCGPSSPRLPPGVSPDSEVSPPGSNWRHSVVRLGFCRGLQMRSCAVRHSHQDATVAAAHCVGGRGSQRCRAAAAAAGVPVMRWWLCLWWCWSSFSVFLKAAAAAAAADDAAKRRSRAHSSDKMAGRKGKGCKNRAGNDLSIKPDQIPKDKYSAFAQATMTVSWRLGDG